MGRKAMLDRHADRLLAIGPTRLQRGAHGNVVFSWFFGCVGAVFLVWGLVSVRLGGEPMPSLLLVGVWALSGSFGAVALAGHQVALARALEKDMGLSRREMAYTKRGQNRLLAAACLMVLSLAAWGLLVSSAWWSEGGPENMDVVLALLAFALLSMFAAVLAFGKAAEELHAFAEAPQSPKSEET